MTFFTANKFENLIEEFIDGILALLHKVPETITASVSKDDAAISWIGMHSLLICLFMVVLLGVLFWGINRSRFWKYAEGLLPAGFLTIWVLGFVVYDVGMCTEDRISLLRNAPMAIIHAFQMFLLESDVSAIHATFHDNAWYMGFFSLSHFLAAFVSLVFVVKLFGFQITNGISRAFASRFRRQRALYVFWGMNEPSYLLAKSILSRYDSTREKSYRIVVVRTNHDDEQQSVSQNGIARMFNFLSLGGNDFEHLQELCGHRHVYSTSTYADISRVNTSNVNEKDFFRTMRLRSVLRFIRHTSSELHVFCLSADEDDNLQATSILKHMLKTLDSTLSIKLYCHARRDGVKRVIEDSTLKQPNMEVRVIDSSHLAVEQLRQDAEAQPVRFVDVETNGTVSSAFNALVIGFGETGRDVVRFLYEFGAFVDSESTDSNVRRSPFLCHIVDSDMENIEPKFIRNCPEARKHLSFLNADYRSEAFYDLLSDIASTLNYVVISVDDDEKNINLAVDILRHVKTVREDLKNFCIYVRAYRQHRIDHLEKIRKYYNESYKAPDATNVIRIFGKPQDIYTDELIVHDLHSEAARKFYDTYRECNTQDNVFLSEGTWEERRLITLGLAEPEFFKASDGEIKMRLRNVEEPSVPSYGSVQKLRRKESQDRSNSLHRLTKIHIFESALGSQWKSLLKTPEGERVRLNLARTEHLRWIAAHELMGYRHDPENLKKADDGKRTHNCLVPWEQLDKISKAACIDYKAYDFAVVDTTLRLYEEEMKEEENKKRQI